MGKKTVQEGKHLKVSGIWPNVKPANGVDFSLEELQTYVGGYIELLPLSDACKIADKRKIKVWVNEDGLPLGLPFNPGASLLFGCHVYGDALIVVSQGALPQEVVEFRSEEMDDLELN